MAKLPLHDSRNRSNVGELKELENLWHARAGRKKGTGAIQSRGSYWPAKQLNILVQSDPERHARHAVIAFPDTGAAYVVQDQLQLKAIILKLMGIYQHIAAKGESSIVSFLPER